MTQEQGECEHIFTTGIDIEDGDGMVRCIDCAERQAPTWLTVLSITREYGGPEEGGWWYTAGEVELDIQMHDLDATERETLYTLMLKCYPRTHRSSSVAGGRDYDVVVGFRTGVAFPEERPHYE